MRRISSRQRPQTKSSSARSHRGDPWRPTAGSMPINGGLSIGHLSSGPSKTSPVRDAVVLDTQLSARLRDQMIAELNELGSSDEAARWAKRRYPDKTKRLNEADAEHIDQCFRTKLLSFAAHDAEGAKRRYRRNVGRTVGPTKWTRCKEAKTVEINRQECLVVPGAAPGAGSRARAVCRSAILPGLWPQALRRPPPALCPELARSAVRSAMSSPSRCAAGITVKSTVTAMKPSGGAKPLSSHWPLPGRCGLRRIRALAAQTDNEAEDAEAKPA